MHVLKAISGIAAPLAIANLDTDQIMPKQFLRGIDRQGLDRGLFYDLRIDAQGRPRPEFVLNQPEYKDANILVGATNFGCGSSREHAVWGLLQAGIQAVIAPSFGEIFYSNAINNRLLVLRVDDEAAQTLRALTTAKPGVSLTVDIESLTIHAEGASYAFFLAPRHQTIFLEGLDMIAATLKSKTQIDAFARRRAETHPWLHGVGRKVAQSLSRPSRQP